MADVVLIFSDIIEVNIVSFKDFVDVNAVVDKLSTLIIVL